MAIEIFLKLEGIAGESVEVRHEGWIEIKDLSWGISHASSNSGSGRAAGRVAFQNVTLVKYVDKSTPSLQLSCCTNALIPDASISVRKPGGSNFEYYRMTLKEVMVASVHLGVSDDDRLIETIELNFSQFTTEYVPQREDGTGNAPIKVGWDLKKNAKT